MTHDVNVPRKRGVARSAAAAIAALALYAPAIALAGPDDQVQYPGYTTPGGGKAAARGSEQRIEVRDADVERISVTVVGRDGKPYPIREAQSDEPGKRVFFIDLFNPNGTTYVISGPSGITKQDLPYATHGVTVAFEPKAGAVAFEKDGKAIPIPGLQAPGAEGAAYKYGTPSSPPAPVQPTGSSASNGAPPQPMGDIPWWLRQSAADDAARYANSTRFELVSVRSVAPDIAITLTATDHRGEELTVFQSSATTFIVGLPTEGAQGVTFRTVASDGKPTSLTVPEIPAGNGVVLFPDSGLFRVESTMNIYSSEPAPEAQAASPPPPPGEYKFGTLNKPLITRSHTITPRSDSTTVIVRLFGIAPNSEFAFDAKDADGNLLIALPAEGTPNAFEFHPKNGGPFTITGKNSSGVPLSVEIPAMPNGGRVSFNPGNGALNIEPAEAQSAEQTPNLVDGLRSARESNPNAPIIPDRIYQIPPTSLDQGRFDGSEATRAVDGTLRQIKRADDKSDKPKAPNQKQQQQQMQQEVPKDPEQQQQQQQEVPEEPAPIADAPPPVNPPVATPVADQQPPQEQAPAGPATSPILLFTGPGVQSGAQPAAGPSDAAPPPQNSGEMQLLPSNYNYSANSGPPPKTTREILEEQYRQQQEQQQQEQTEAQTPPDPERE